MIWSDFTTFQLNWQWRMSVESCSLLPSTVWIKTSVKRGSLALFIRPVKGPYGPLGKQVSQKYLRWQMGKSAIFGMYLETGFYRRTGWLNSFFFFAARISKKMLHKFQYFLIHIVSNIPKRLPNKIWRDWITMFRESCKLTKFYFNNIVLFCCLIIMSHYIFFPVSYSHRCVSR